MFPRYLQYLLTDFRQTFVTGASWDTDDLFTFLGQKVKVQGHTIAAEAHSTRRYRRVQLFLVFYWRKTDLHGELSQRPAGGPVKFGVLFFDARYAVLFKLFNGLITRSLKKVFVHVYVTTTIVTQFLLMIKSL